MTFEFLIACRTTPDTNLRQTLNELLAEVLESNDDEFDHGTIAGMIQLRHERPGNKIDNEGKQVRHTLVGFVVELPDEIESPRDVIDEFASSLPDSPPIFHAVKFDDPLLQAELAKRAEQIYTLEMKLRRALSLIYLHAYQSREPFNLLRDERVKPIGSPTPQQMQSAAENQFFHLTFGNYSALNQRREIRLKDLPGIIRDADTYEKFCEEFRRVPIVHEGDSELLAGLSNLMEVVEKMRNCVAHNRRPGTRLTENYNNALPQLHELLDNYLSRWGLFPLDLSEEMPWDSATREAVERVLEGAIWDHEARTIRLNDYGARETATSLDELQQFLEQVASQTYYANVPFEDGEPVFQCDEYGVVESVLSDHEERLTEFFDENGTDDVS